MIMTAKITIRPNMIVCATKTYYCTRTVSLYNSNWAIYYVIMIVVQVVCY